MLFINESRKCWGKIFYNVEILVLKSYSILCLIPNITYQELKCWFSLTRCLHYWKNHCEGKIIDIFASQHNNYDCKWTIYYAEKCQAISESFQYQNLYGCKSIYVEGVSLHQVNKFKSSTVPMAQCHSHLSDESDQDVITNATYFIILIKFIHSKIFIVLYLTTMWYHIYDCANQYHCSFAIHILSFIFLDFLSLFIKKLVHLGTTKMLLMLWMIYTNVCLS